MRTLQDKLVSALRACEAFANAEFQESGSKAAMNASDDARDAIDEYEAQQKPARQQSDGELLVALATPSSEGDAVNALLAVSDGAKLAQVLRGAVARLDQLGFDDPDNDVNGGDCVELVGELLPQLRRVLADHHPRPAAEPIAGAPAELERIIVLGDGGSWEGFDPEQVRIMDITPEAMEDLCAGSEPSDLAQAQILSDRSIAALARDDLGTLLRPIVRSDGEDLEDEPAGPSP